MTGHEQTGDDAAAWVLGMLSAAEAQEFERHLATCSECQEEVRRLEGVTDALALSSPAAPSSPELRHRLLAGTESETALFRAAEDRGPIESPVRRRRPGAAVLAGLAALMLLGAGVLVGRVIPSDDPASRASTVIGMVTPAGGGADARAAVLLRGQTGQLVLTGLAAPPAGRVYQAWVVRSDRIVPTGALFSVPRSGDTKVSLPSLAGVRRVIVTAEGPRGSRTPTPPAIAAVVLPR